jgi:hypothetical protein
VGVDMGRADPGLARWVVLAHWVETERGRFSAGQAGDGGIVRERAGRMTGVAGRQRPGASDRAGCGERVWRGGQMVGDGGEG